MPVGALLLPVSASSGLFGSAHGLRVSALAAMKDRACLPEPAFLHRAVSSRPARIGMEEADTNLMIACVQRVVRPGGDPPGSGPLEGLASGRRPGHCLTSECDAGGRQRASWALRRVTLKAFPRRYWPEARASADCLRGRSWESRI